MAPLVSLTDVKQMLRIPSSDDDIMLVLLMDAASQAVINYLGDRADSILDFDTNGEFISGSPVPGPVHIATIMLVGYLYENIDSDPERVFEAGYLPKPVTALLYPLRDPALA